MASKRWAFVLINLEGVGSFFFDFFPREIQTVNRANWEQQDTTIGVKPLFYANREPQRISVPEVFLDSTDAQQSIVGEIAALQELLLEIPKFGRPPALLASWGNEEHRVILEELTINRRWFSGDGNPQRASVSLQLLQLQEQRESTDVTVKGADEK
jgi:hypothetical protein